MHRFNRVGGVDHFSDRLWVAEVDREIVPFPSPGQTKKGSSVLFHITLMISSTQGEKGSSGLLHNIEIILSIFFFIALSFFSRSLT